jgi:hypothetical protein
MTTATEGEIVVTWAGDEIVLVSRQDDEGRILKVLAEKGKPPSHPECTACLAVDGCDPAAHSHPCGIRIEVL